MNLFDAENLISGSAAEQTGTLKIAIVASRFNRFIVDSLLEGAMDALARTGVTEQNISLAWVPGAFELPLIAQKIVTHSKADAVIALGAVVRGGTPHFDYVAGECATGLMRVSLKHDVPVIFGVLTTDTVEQALERAGTGEGNKGYDCAVTAIEMALTTRAIETQFTEQGAHVE